MGHPCPPPSTPKSHTPARPVPFAALNLIFGAHMWVHYYYASTVWSLKLTLWSIGAIVTYECVFASPDFEPRPNVVVDGDANKENVCGGSVLCSVIQRDLAYRWHCGSCRSQSRWSAVCPLSLSPYLFSQRTATTRQDNTCASKCQHPSRR